jgi:3'-5' exoribonuclease
MTHVQIPLAEMQVGDQLAHIVRIKKVTLIPGKSKPFLSFTIGDKSGNNFPAKKWGEGKSGATPEDVIKYKNFKVALVTGEKQTYNNKEDFLLKSIAEIAEDFSESLVKELLGDDTATTETNGENMEKPKGNGSWILQTKAEVDFESVHKAQKPLKNCEDSEPLNHVLRVCSISFGTTAGKDGKPGIPYADFMLGDAVSQPLKGRLWRPADGAEESFKDVKILYVQGKTELYNGALQIKYTNDQITIVSDAGEADINALMLSSPYPIKTLANGIWEIVQSFEDPMLKKLCESLLKDPKNKNFRFVPAGVTYHHSWRSGLIEHTYRLLLLLNDFVNLYNETPLQSNRVRLNRDAILTIGLYHDFFKHCEYTVECGYAPAGNLLRHLSRAVIDIGARSSQIDNFPELYQTVLAHGVAAHHGKKEWDAIETPGCPEGLVVHWFDNLCSKVDPTLTELNLLKGENKYSTNRLKPLNSIPYLGGCKLGSVVPFTSVTLAENYTKKDLEKCIKEMVGNIQNPHIKTLCEQTLDYSAKEYAKDSHRTALEPYMHGLLEYTCRTMLFIGKFVNSYNEKGWPGNNIYLDSDFLVAGALLQSYFNYKRGDPMLEGVGTCLLTLGKLTSQIKDFPDELRDLMGQIVASQEEGGPENPICPESITNHYYLNVLLKLDTMNLILSSSAWKATDVIPMFEKKITLGLCSLKD